ncbi:enoyl-CoA hydratase [Gordonia sp. HY002]|uniref:MaoC/PaaZ C-terminal domain-containing protein n=1 Tax=Gordonia zhenghanii TaxID=2911516 RepID=UPI001EEFEE35|nr:MaoC/PaaZ C-terminal domain-containing protein [Gordonia zhenghanii]MCF8570391.1 enoyl-CoA hydratase [Gordonia zhenghanii]MCF8604621.1 enoyl-CoA hydratase [Gordonia zhenghanii]
MSPALAELSGTDLGTHTASYDDRDCILYALAVGAKPTELDLVYERDLRVLPTYACAIGLWAVEAAGRLGAYDPTRSLHASQALTVHRPLPASGKLPMTGRIGAVYDKGKASMVEVVVESEWFSATYSIFLPGTGGWGGDRGPSSSGGDWPEPTRTSEFVTDTDLAALYRLTGDRHPIHIDPDVARANSFDRPILHGLCTVGIAARVAAEQTGAHPAELRSLNARLAAPVLPGDTLIVRSDDVDGVVYFDTVVGETAVLLSGTAEFGS